MPRAVEMLSGNVAVDGSRRREQGRASSVEGDAASVERAEMPVAETWVRFRCRCGRSVATPSDTAAADERLCSRCRERAAFRTDHLRREHE